MKTRYALSVSWDNSAADWKYCLSKITIDEDGNREESQRWSSTDPAWAERQADHYNLEVPEGGK